MSRYTEQMDELATIGAELCAYNPGNPETWPAARCDCKYLRLSFTPDEQPYISSEVTGCAEVRAAYRALASLNRYRPEPRVR